MSHITILSELLKKDEELHSAEKAAKETEEEMDAVYNRLYQQIITDMSAVAEVLNHIHIRLYDVCAVVNSDTHRVENVFKYDAENNRLVIGKGGSEYVVVSQKNKQRLIQCIGSMSHWNEIYERILSDITRKVSDSIQYHNSQVKEGRKCLDGFEEERD